MNLFPSHWPLLQKGIVNQAKYRGIRRAELDGLFVSAQGRLMVSELC